MFRNFRLTTTMVPLGTLLAVLLLACQSAQAQVKPFKVTGTGISLSGMPLPGQSSAHWAVGQATHLGRYYGEGIVHTEAITGFDPETGIISAEFSSGAPFVFEGANGDLLVCHYGRDDLPVAEGGTGTPGAVTLYPLGDGVYVALFIAEFVPIQSACTGKFAGVKGGWTMYALSEPFVLGATDPVAYSWQGEGSLEFARGGK